MPINFMAADDVFIVIYLGFFLFLTRKMPTSGALYDKLSKQKKVGDSTVEGGQFATFLGFPFSHFPPSLLPIKKMLGVFFSL